jgi:hypothetical protein
LDQKLQFTGTYTKASIKDFKATEQGLTPQKRTSGTSNHKISSFFLLLRVIFALLDPDPDSKSGFTEPD